MLRRRLARRGKGKGRRLSGRAISTFALELSDLDDEAVFYGRGKGKGKGKRSGRRSSGKGSGREQNPRGRDGQVMKCLGNNGQCGSTTHQKRDCPHEPGNQNRTDTHL
eukprot:6934905-Karenia_brevis.AAC.1